MLLPEVPEGSCANPKSRSENILLPQREERGRHLRFDRTRSRHQAGGSTPAPGRYLHATPRAREAQATQIRKTKDAGRVRRSQ